MLLLYTFLICCLSQLHCSDERFLNEGLEYYEIWKEIFAAEIAKAIGLPMLKEASSLICLCSSCHFPTSTSSILNGGTPADTSVVKKRRKFKVAFVESLVNLMIKYDVPMKYFPKFREYVLEII